MKTEIKIIRYTDPGHGWLRVTLKMLVKLGIADKITPFSYVRTVYAYLEEDVDATLFLDTLKAKGKTVTYVERHTNRFSRIRNYASYGFTAPATASAVVTDSVSAPAADVVDTQADSTPELA